MNRLRTFIARFSTLAIRDNKPMPTSMFRVENKKPAVEEYLPLVIAVVGAVGILPFAIIRLINGEYLIALLDTTLIFGLAGLALYLIRTHRVRGASIALALLSVAGVVATIYLMGSAQVYWVFPVLLGVFILLQRREALIVSLIAIAAIAPIVFRQFDTVTVASILITIFITCSLAFAFATTTRDQRDELMRLAIKDPLTGAGNRRALEQKLSEVIAARSRVDAPSSLLMLDLDNFKNVNDEHGHDVGDQILIRITEIINMRIRVTDSVYRIGGEEFMVVVEGETIENASRLAEQLRTIVEANDLARSGTVTISIGVAQHDHGESAKSWCRRADQALYEAKDAGRNTIKLSA